MSARLTGRNLSRSDARDGRELSGHAWDATPGPCRRAFAAGPVCPADCAGCSERAELFCHDPSRCLYAARNVTSLFGTGLKRLVEYMGWRIGVSMRVPFVSRLCIPVSKGPSRAHAMLSMGYSMNGGYVSANAREGRQQGGCTTMQRAKQISESIELGIILALAGGFMDVYSYMGAIMFRQRADGQHPARGREHFGGQLGAGGALLLPCGFVCCGHYACRPGTRAFWQRDPLGAR